MSRYISLNFRSALRSPATPDGLIYLVTVDHPGFPEDLRRFSSDPTEMRIIDGEVRYGTQHGNGWYHFMLMGLRVPDDTEDAPPSTTLEIAETGAGLVEQLRASLTPAMFSLAAIRMRDIGFVEFDYDDMELRRSRANKDRISLDISRYDPGLEPCPAGVMTAGRAPGVHR